MNNLKLRAWDKKEKKMCNVVAIWFSLGSIILENGIYVYERKLDEVEIMLSTGLKDKNGVEIYEGDILKTSIKNLVVEWVPKGACWGIGCHYLFHYYETSEVIGNIYENPELLEDK